MKVSMITNVFIFIIFVLFLLFIGNTEISLSPFKIKILEWWKPLGIFFMILGFIIYIVGSNQKSYKDGWNKAKNEIINEHGKKD